MILKTAAPAALDASLLPSATSRDLLVVPVTSAEYEQTWHLNGDEWRGPLTTEQYFERERFLLEQDLTKDGGITGWILTSKSLPLNADGTRPILACCETILKTAYKALDGKVDTIKAHGICSVFTRAEYRGRGYAGRMMEEVGKQLETYQQSNGDKGTFSILFSDVGRKFYAKYGWEAYASTHIHLTPLGTDKYQSSKGKWAVVRDMTRDDLVRLPMVQYTEETLHNVSKQSAGVPCVAVRPDMQHFDWHHAREEVQAQILGLPVPQVKGAIHEATGVAVVWGRVFASNPQEWTLHLLHLVVPPSIRENPTEEVRNALAALLLRAQHEAHIWNMAGGVQAWDPTELTIAAAQSLRTEDQGKVEIIRRDIDHICSLRWTQPRVEGTDHGVKWVNMEKYTWC